LTKKFKILIFLGFEIFAFLDPFFFCEITVQNLLDHPVVQIEKGKITKCNNLKITEIIR